LELIRSSKAKIRLSSFFIFVIFDWIFYYRRRTAGFLFKNNLTTRKCCSIVSIRTDFDINHDGKGVAVELVDAATVVDDDYYDDDTVKTFSKTLLQFLVLNDNRHRKRASEKEKTSSQQQKLLRQKEILLSRFNNTYLNIHRTYVDKSPIAGRGLFASRDSPRGTLLTCYPGDALVDLTTGNITWGSHTNTAMAVLPEEINQDYMLRAVCEDWGIVALPELHDDDNNDDLSYLGHFANDGAVPPLCESELASYVIESADKANAMHQECQGCHMVTVVTKDIKAGEEILVTYGPEYWSQNPSFGVDHKTTTQRIPASSPPSISSTRGKGFG